MSVAALVLRNNYLQTLALSLAQRRGLEDLGFEQRLMQSLGKAGRARPRGRVPARRHGDRRAPAPLAAVDPARARGAAGLCQAVAQSSICVTSQVPDDPYLARELTRYFPGEIAEQFPDAHRAPPAAAGDHRHPACQFDDQPRRPVAGRAHCRSDRRGGARHRAGLRGGARQLRHVRAQWRDRRARQPGTGQAAARTLRGGGGTAARPSGLVPAQRRSDARASPLSSSITATGIAAVESALDGALLAGRRDGTKRATRPN